MCYSSFQPDGLTVWIGKSSGSANKCLHFLQLLDSEERERANAIKSSIRSQLFVESHGWLRSLLGETARVPPEQLIFSKSAHGKPFLADFPSIAFNLSHTDNLFAIAIGHNCNIGIDIESIKPRVNLTGLAAKCFAPAELAYWQNLPTNERLPAFYRIWTKKEAFVKAVGHGIALGLQKCAIEPYRQDQMLEVPIFCGDPLDWSLTTLDLGLGYCGALAVNGNSAEIKIKSIDSQDEYRCDINN